jgi:hypothetical protein
MRSTKQSPPVTLSPPVLSRLSVSCRYSYEATIILNVLLGRKLGMKVHVKEWSAVGYWVWDVKDEDDICGICQNAFDGVCGTCEEPGDQCPLRE